MRRFMFSRCRTTTISGIAVAMASNGQRLAKSQAGARAIARISARGKATEAVIEAKETYRHIRTTAAHTTIANSAQIE